MNKRSLHLMQDNGHLRRARRRLGWDIWVILLCGPIFGLLMELLDVLTFLIAWACVGRELLEFRELWEIQSARTSKLWMGRLVLAMVIGVVLLFVRAVKHRRVMLNLYIPIVWLAALIVFLLLNVILIRYAPYDVTTHWVFSCVLAGLAIVTGLLLSRSTRPIRN